MRSLIKVMLVIAAIFAALHCQSSQEDRKFLVENVYGAGYGAFVVKDKVKPRLYTETDGWPEVKRGERVVILPVDDQTWIPTRFGGMYAVVFYKMTPEMALSVASRAIQEGSELETYYYKPVPMDEATARKPKRLKVGHSEPITRVWPEPPAVFEAAVKRVLDEKAPHKERLSKAEQIWLEDLILQDLKKNCPDCEVELKRKTRSRWWDPFDPRQPEKQPYKAPLPLPEPTQYLPFWDAVE